MIYPIKVKVHAESEKTLIEALFSESLPKPGLYRGCPGILVLFSKRVGIGMFNELYWSATISDKYCQTEFKGTHIPCPLD